MADNTAILAALTNMAKSLEGAIKILRKGDSSTPRGDSSTSPEIDVVESYEYDDRPIREQIKLMGELKEAYQQLSDSADNLIDKYDDLQLSYAVTTQEAEEKFNKGLRELREELESGNITSERYAERLKKLREEFAKTGEVAQNAANANDGLKKQTKSLLKTLTGVSSETKSFTGSLLEAKNPMLSLGAAIKETFTPSNIFNSVTAKMEESTVRMVKRTDEAFASFNRLTGAGGSLNQTMFDAQYEARALGVTVESAAAAAGVLYTQMSNFTELSDKAQRELIKSAASMEALGISSETTAGLMDVSMNSLRMSQDEAKALSDDLAKLALGLEMPPAALAEGFRKALPTLSAYGKGAEKVFKGLAAAAKATSISTQELLGIFGESMDTFEGSAQAAGGLNALLGGNLVNSMELLYATEDERIQIVKRAMDATGRNWDMLDKFEKKAIAARIGITDLNTANKLFGTSSEQVDHYTNSLDALGISQEDLDKRQQAGISLTQKLSAIFDKMSLAVMPIVDGLNGFLDAILRLDKDLKGNLIPGLGLLTAAVSGLLAVATTAKMTAWVLKFIGLTGPLTTATGVMSGAFATMAASAKAAFSGMAASASAAAGPILAALSPVLLILGAIGGGLLLAKGIGSALGMDMSMENIAGSFMNAGGAVKDFFTFGNDVIMRPGEKPIMLNKDDIVLAGTNLLGEQAARNTGVVNNATYNTSNVSNTTQTAAPSAPMKERDLVIQINGREIGRVAADYIRKEYSLVNNSGY